MKKLWTVLVVLLLLHSLLEAKKRDCKGCKWCIKKEVSRQKRLTKKGKKNKQEQSSKKEKADPLVLSQQLITAIKENKPLAVLEELVDKGADVDYQDKEKRTPLHWAAIYALPDAVELLLIHKSDIYAQDYRGNTPLHLVAMFRPHPSNREKIVRLLLFEGASIYDRNVMGLNVLEAAITTELRSFILLTSFKRSFIRRTTT